MRNNQPLDELPYHKMSSAVFHVHALFLLLSTLSIAIILTKIDFVFDLFGAVFVSCSLFLFPSVGFLVVYSRYPANRPENVRFYLVLAWIFVFLGVTMIASGITVNVMRSMGAFTFHED